MKKTRYGLIALWMLICSATFASADVSIGIGFPTVSIGINLPMFPELVPVPGYPVYYAPQVDSNYFFYDGMYWVYQNDNWYASSWYNGPWGFVEPEVVPLFVLRIPVRYYQQPPVYFRGWQSNAAPRWGQHWGRGWEQHRRGWDSWNRSSAPSRAPLPVYQRQYSRDRYPQVEQQNALRGKSYRYQPRDKVVREHFKRQAAQKAPAPARSGRQDKPQTKNPNQQREQVKPGQRQQPAVQQRAQQAPRQQDQRQQKQQEQRQQKQQKQQEQRQQRQQPAAQRQQAPRQQEQKQQRQQPAAQPQQAPRQQEQRQQAPRQQEQRQQRQQPAAQQQQAPRQQEQRQQRQQQPDRGQGQGGQRQDEGRGGGRNN